MNSEKPLIQAARGLKPSRHPVWFLRQAGRYLPEYREIRSKLEFLDLCRNPALASEVTLQPLRRYDVDAAIIFSDILVPCVAMGQKLTFDKGHGPVLKDPIRSAADLAKLQIPDCQKELGYVGEAIQKTREGLTATQTMIGFAGAPFTVATYMIEGSGSKTFAEVKKLRFQQTETFSNLLDMLEQVTIEYLGMQIQAGAEVVMLFDTWATQCSQDDFSEFVLPCVNRIIRKVKEEFDIPVVYYPGQGISNYFCLQSFCGDVIAVDWRPSLQQVVNIFDEMKLDVSVQGNLDPFSLLSTEEQVRNRVRKVIEGGKKARGHIFNLGHGMLPFTDPKALEWVVSEIRK